VVDRKDEEDRSKWVEVFRHANKPLGEIIKDTMDQREASWILPERTVERTISVSQPATWNAQGAPPSAKGEGGKGAKLARKQQKKAPADQAQGGAEPASVAARADGKPLCAGWNAGTSNGTQCPNGQMHACNR